MPKLKTLAQFIQDARKVHGDKYDYSQSVYVSSKKRIKIICPHHGEFWQRAADHVIGKGCFECGKQAKTFTLDEFLRRSRKCHGDKYDYSQVKYINAATKVKVICPIHGQFLSRPEGHIRGRGCPKCAHDKLRRTQESFVDDAAKAHGNTYDYSQVNYVSASHKVKIICFKHGVFEQSPRCHLSGRGCPQCFGTHQKSFLQFVKEAQSVHGDKYDYSEADYRNTDVKVKIICSTHGEFWQTPYQHIKRGNGCPRCSANGLNYAKPTFLYLLFFQKPKATFWKVGITNTSIKKRFPEHRFISQSFVWKFADGWQAESVEKTVLATFSGYSLPPNPEILKTGYTECFVEHFPVEIAVVLIESMFRRITAKSP